MIYVKVYIYVAGSIFPSGSTSTSLKYGFLLEIWQEDIVS